MYFRARYNKVLLESMLELIYSTVSTSENKTVGRIFRTDDLSEKFEDFFYFQSTFRGFIQQYYSKILKP